MNTAAPHARPISAILLTDGLRDVPLTGIGRYVLELAQRLNEHPGISDLLFFARRGWVKRPWETALQSPDNQDQSSLFAKVRHRLPCRVLQDRISLALKKRAFSRKNKELEGYVLHGPNYLLLPHGGPSLVTIHDLSFIHYPECHPRERIKLMERELPRTLQQADRILTVSRFARQEIADVLGFSRDKIHVAYNGVDARFHPRTRTETSETMHTFGLEHGSYLLCVATLEPRKNLVRLVRAYSRLPGTLTARYPLILAGVRGWLTQSLENLIHPLERAGKIRRLGYVHEQLLPDIYAGAAGLALPSLYEGFGLPVLEAMACAVPVLTSDCSSLPEVAKDAALLVNPFDEDAIFQGLQRLLADDTFREHARQNGPVQAGRFSWANCVEQTVAAYQHALGIALERAEPDLP